MEISKGLPKSFFEKPRTIASKDSLKDIIPFVFTDDEKVRKGKYKKQTIINLTRKK